MFTSVSRKLLHPILAMTLAATLVVSPLSSSQAEARGRHGGDNLVAALVALGLLGLIVTNENNRDRTDVRSVPQSRRLPAACLKTYSTNRGRRSIFTRHCMRQNFRWWRNLPRACEIRLPYYDRYGDRNYIRGYAPTCLRDYGYRVVDNY